LFYVHTDHLDTPRRISRPSDNAILWRWDSDPFGTRAPNEDADGDGTSFTYNLRFAGQYFDSEDGLAYNGFRDYDRATGRYVESDPLGLFGGLNTYGYVGGQPTSSVDPFGLAKCTLVFYLGQGELRCYPDNPQNAPVSIPVSSGNNGAGLSCKNNPDCEAKNNRGPIPSGCWQWTGGSTKKPNGRVLKECDGWPRTGRTDIRSHSCLNPFGPAKGPKFCSEGCVTGTVKDIQKLNKLLDAEPGSILNVVPPAASFDPALPGAPRSERGPF
jgi:RHS repeat-associated protein